MAIQTDKIENFLGGFSETQSTGSNGTYNISLGIDPDYSLADTDITGAVTQGQRTSGYLMPTRYEKFSGSNVSGHPKWLIANPKDTNIYAYMSDGKFVSYSSSLGSETLIGTPTSGAGNGMAYYNNYIYLATPTDISRYGPLTSSPALTNTVWTGATLGSHAATANSTYPVSRLTLPNHPMHVHGDNKLYFADYNDAGNPGKGTINYIKTKKTTNEGDTNDLSNGDALVLPFGFRPTDIESYGTDLVVAACQTTDSTINQGNAALFFWDTTSLTFYRGPLYMPDALVTALKFVNGVLYIFSGSASRGTRLSKYIGGDSTQELMFIEGSFPPCAGAVEALGNRIVWGSYTEYGIVNTIVVQSYGSKDNRLPKGLGGIILPSLGSGKEATISSLLNYHSQSFLRPRLIVGWGIDS